MSRAPAKGWTDGELQSVLNIGHLCLRAGISGGGWAVYARARGMEGAIMTGHGGSLAASKLAAEDYAVSIAMGILRASGFDEAALDRLDRPGSAYRPHVHRFVNDACACGERDD